MSLAAAISSAASAIYDISTDRARLSSLIVVLAVLVAVAARDYQPYYIRRRLKHARFAREQLRDVGSESLHSAEFGTETDRGRSRSRQSVDSRVSRLPARATSSSRPRSRGATLTSTGTPSKAHGLRRTGSSSDAQRPRAATLPCMLTSIDAASSEQSQPHSLLILLFAPLGLVAVAIVAGWRIWRRAVHRALDATIAAWRHTLKAAIATATITNWRMLLTRARHSTHQLYLQCFLPISGLCIFIGRMLFSLIRLALRICHSSWHYTRLLVIRYVHYAQNMIQVSKYFYALLRLYARSTRTIRRRLVGHLYYHTFLDLGVAETVGTNGEMVIFHCWQAALKPACLELRSGLVFIFERSRRRTAIIALALAAFSSKTWMLFSRIGRFHVSRSIWRLAIVAMQFVLRSRQHLAPFCWSIMLPAIYWARQLVHRARAIGYCSARLAYHVALRIAGLDYLLLLRRCAAAVLDPSRQTIFLVHHFTRSLGSLAARGATSAFSALVASIRWLGATLYARIPDLALVRAIFAYAFRRLRQISAVLVNQLTLSAAWLQTLVVEVWVALVWWASSISRFFEGN